MNQKLTVQLEVVKGDHTFVFAMPAGAPLGSAYDAAFEVLNQLLEFSKNAAKQAERKEVDNNPVAENSNS